MTAQTDRSLIPENPLPDDYRKTTRILLRFALAMAIFGLLVGISYQESAHKLTFAEAPGGLRQDATLPLALVHGHIFTLGVLLPLALAAAMHLSLRTGSKPLGGKTLATLTHIFLPFATASLLLQLFKGYFILLAVRHGQHDMALVDASFLGGSAALRYGIYAVVHSGMGISLGIFLVALWRSMGKSATD